MKNKTLFIVALLSFSATFTYAQLLHNVKEYKIGFSGKFLSYYTPSNEPTTTFATNEPITTTNPVTGQITTINRPVAKVNATMVTPNNKTNKGAAVISSNTAINPNSTSTDSLTMESYSEGGQSTFYKEKQIWIIDYVTVGVFEPYYTIQNKVSGKYLTQGDKKVSLKPFIVSGSNSQKWRFNNLEESSQNQLPFKGETKEMSIVCEIGGYVNRGMMPAILRLNNNVVSLDNFGSSLDYVIDGDRAKNQRSTVHNFFITPYGNFRKIELTDITYSLCPTILINGDREFNGFNDNGFLRQLIEGEPYHQTPLTTFEIKLSISADATQIYADIMLNVKELKLDKSETEGRWKILVYTAPAGQLLDEIVSYKNYYTSHSGHLTQHIYQTNINVNSEFLNYASVIGDTMGTDVSEDSDCNDDTRVAYIDFRSLYVRFK